MRFSIIIPAYKEKAVNKVLKLLLKQSLPANWKLDKIFVVACGYKSFPFLKNRKILLIKENQRHGKAYALDLALKKIESNRNIDVIVVHNADVFPKSGMLKKLLTPFETPEVGITCVRPVSLDNSKKFVGFMNTFIWKLHHIVSLESPKVGEVFAFRNVIKKIPKKLATDEAYIESLLRKKYKIIYVPNAIVFNIGPQIISEDINQRRRIFAGHIHVKTRYRHKVSTMSVIRIIKAVLRYLKTEPIESPKQIFWLMFAVILEAYARVLGIIDFYVFKKVPYVWRITKSSRNNLE